MPVYPGGASVALLGTAVDPTRRGYQQASSGDWPAARLGTILLHGAGTVRAYAPLPRTMDARRERIIRETWLHFGHMLWNAYKQGDGEPLIIGNCEFRLELRNIEGRMKPCVVCEVLVVEVSP